MLRPYVKLFFLLAVAFGLFAVFSRCRNVRIFGHEPAVMDFSLSNGFVRNELPVPVCLERDDSCRMDTARKVILLVGDSMLEHLRKRFGAYAGFNGHELYAVIWYGSTSELWARSGRLKLFMNRFRPDYVFACIGGNELFVKNAQSRGKYIELLVKEMGKTPFVWIGPPNWKDDTGINGELRQKVGNGRFFESKGIALERAADGMHPSLSAACEWGDSIAEWVMRRSEHPIRLSRPDKLLRDPDETILLMPDD